MQLKLLIPTQILVDRQVSKIVAEAENGSFCILPRHVDFVAALVPGLFMYTDEAGSEEFLALDSGILVKCGKEVQVSVANAARGRTLEELHTSVQEQFQHADEQEKKAHSVLARMEADFVSRFAGIREPDYV